MNCDISFRSLVYPSPSCGKVWDFLAKHGDLMECVEMLGINILLFGSLTFRKVPAVLPDGIVTYFAYTGIKALPFWVERGVKEWKDMALGFKHKACLLTAICAAQTFYTFTSLGFTVGGFAGAVSALLNCPKLENFIYSSLTLPGKISVNLGFCLMLASIWIKYRACQECENKANLTLSPFIRAALNKDTLLLLETRMNASSGRISENDREWLLNSLKDDLKYAQGIELAFRIAGTALLLFQKMVSPSPKCLLTAGTNLAFSAGWTIKLIYEKKLISARQ